MESRKIELGGRTGLLGPIRPIASRSTQIERASVEPRSGTLTIAICLNKRRQIMEAWARYIATPAAKTTAEVIALAAR